MRAGRVHAAILSMSLLLVACASPPPGLFPPEPGEPATSIYLVSHGWHAGIVVRRADIPPGIWPQHRDIPDSEYLEVGWGDKDYYMTPQPGLWITLKAGLLPSASVLHVVGFDGPVTRYFSRSEVIRIDLSRAGFERLCALWTDETFDPNEQAYYYARVVEVPTCRWSTRMRPFLTT